MFEPTVESLLDYQCPEWFRNAKFGIWSHRGPQSVPMYGDWYARSMYMEGSAQYLHHWRMYGHPSKHGWKDMVKILKLKVSQIRDLLEKCLEEKVGNNIERLKIQNSKINL